MTSDDWSAARRRRRRRGKRAGVRRRRRAWAAVYAATAGAVVVGGSGLLGRWSPAPSEWWPQVAAMTLPVVGPLALPAAVAVGAVTLRSRRFGGGVCTVALAALFAGWALRTSAPAPAASGPFRVMTLNIGGVYNTEGEVASYVERMQPDVVVLQEAALSWGPYAPAAARIAALDGYRLYKNAEEGGGRQVTLSRVPVRAYESGYLGAAEDHAGVYSRIVVAWEGQDVVIYNVHLRPFNPEVGWSLGRALSPSVWRETPGNLREFFAEQSVEAEALARRVREETSPTIVAGDFNSTPDQWSRGLLSRSLREVTSRWLPDATRPDGLPVANVDGILVSDDWGVAGYDVGPPGLSDHRAVLARLALRP